MKFIFLLLVSFNTFALDLTFCPQTPVITFDPAQMYDATSNSLKNLVFEGLFESNYVQNIVPVLATKAQFSPDKKTLTVEFKPNVFFHSNDFFKPTRPMNADDVIFTFKRQMPNHTSFWGWKSASSFTKNIKDIVKKNSTTVEFILNEPMENFLSFFTRHTSLILSQEYYKAKPKEFELHPIGTGPLKLANGSNKDEFTLTKHSAYHGTSKLNSLKYVVMADNDEIQAGIKKGDCDLIDSPPVYFIKEATQSGKYKRIAGIENNLSYIAFNTTKSPLNLPEVRKAIAHALDLKKYQNEIYLDFAKIASLPAGPPFPEYQPSILPVNYDLNLSRELLKKYKFEKGFDVTLWTFNVPRTYLPEPEKLAKLIQSDLQKINVRVKIVSKPVDELQKRAQRGEHDLLMTGWSNVENTKDAYSDLPCANGDQGMNDAKWCNGVFTETYYEFGKEKDPKKKMELAKKMGLIFKQEMPWALLFYGGKNFLLKSTLPDDLLTWNEFHNHLRKVIAD